MSNIFTWILAPLSMGAGMFLFWRKLKKHYKSLKRYYNLVLVLTDAIEKIETLTGIIPDKIADISRIIKKFVRNSLSRDDRNILDDVLKDKGYLEKKGGGN